MLYRLDPFLDKEGILRVGGRIHQPAITSKCPSAQNGRPSHLLLLPIAAATC